MIKFMIEDQELDLESGTVVQVEYHSSLFDVDRIPGVLTYPVTLPWSKHNKRLLGFPGNLSVRRYRREPFDCGMYLGNLWRKGKLYILGTSDKGISVSFTTDVGDLGEDFKNRSLRELDLGSDAFTDGVRGLYPASNYALFPVKNPDFYGDKANPGYCGYLNYYDGGFVPNDRYNLATYTRTPFPYLVHIMRRVMACFGYSITGDWLEQEETRRLVIYNTTAIDRLEPNIFLQEQNVFASQIHYNRHVPDMKANEFMKAVRAAFGLAFLFNPTTRVMEVVQLREVIENTAYRDWSANNMRVNAWKPNDSDGFRLELTPDPDDERNKSLASESYTFQVGKGKEPITVGLGTLQQLQEEDALKAGRGWSIPQALQQGSSDVLGVSGRHGLSLLSYRGLVPDSAGGQYPYADGARIAWAGAEGLYELYHRHWLEFLGQTESIEAEIDLGLTDLRLLRPDVKVLTEAQGAIVKALWQKVSFSVSLQDGVRTAKVPLYKVQT